MRSCIALNALDDWVTSPSVIWSANSRGAWITNGSGSMIWLIVRFQPNNVMLRRTNAR